MAVLAQLSNRQEPSHEANTADACDNALTQNLDRCIRPTSEDASTDSQRHVTLYCEESDNDSSSSDQFLQSTAASARPSCRRRAALDSDSDSEQVHTECQGGVAQLPTQGQNPSVYTFDLSDSDHADTPEVGPSFPLEALLLNGAACQRKKSVSDHNVIVLDSSDEEEDIVSCRRHNHLLCRCVRVCVLQGAWPICLCTLFCLSVWVCLANLFMYTLLPVCLGLPGVYLLMAVSWQ